MFSLAFVAFIAGMLTILAPCVLPVLPVILAGSLTEKKSWYPLLVTLSLAISIVLFTIFLKASTLLIDIPLSFWNSFSGAILIFLGAVYLFPHQWAALTEKLGFTRTNISLDKAQGAGSPVVRAILTGLALGPVFSTCSPTYALLLATVFPVSFVAGVVYTLIYALGLALMLVLIILGGRNIIAKFRIYADEGGWFRRILGVILIAVGLLIISGIDKKLETALIEKFDISRVEQSVLDRFLPRESSLEGNMTSAPVPTASISGTIIPPLAIKNPFAAPELTGLTDWINSDPLTLTSLKGKVVLIDFWTYSCINCQRTLPYLIEWDKKYRDKGLVIIGVHAPEFAFERIPTNVAKAVKDVGINYPVALDNTFATWGAYKNQYWPAKYFIDRDGNLRHYHFGEGEYEESEKVIQYLLGINETSLGASEIKETKKGEQSPETYLGITRRANYKIFPTELAQNEWTLSPNKSKNLGDSWQEEDESILAKGSGGTLSIHYQASDVYIVLGGTGQVQVSSKEEGGTDFGDDVKNGTLTIDGDRMYHIVHHEKNEENILSLEFSSGARAYAFTFGSIAQTNIDATRMKPHGYQEYRSDILESALTSGQKVILFFHAPWCPTCRALEADIDRDPSAIPGDTLILKVDYDSEDDLKKKYNVRVQHTLVTLNPDATEKSKQLGGIRLKDILSP